MLTKVIAFIAVAITGSLLLYGVADFPSFGDPNSPANRIWCNPRALSQRPNGRTHCPGWLKTPQPHLRGQ